MQEAILDAAMAAANREHPEYDLAEMEYELSVRGKDLNRPYAYEVVFANRPQAREPTFPSTITVVLSVSKLMPLSVTEEKERSLQDVINDTIKVECVTQRARKSVHHRVPFVPPGIGGDDDHGKGRRSEAVEPKDVQTTMHQLMLGAAKAVRAKYPRLALDRMSYIVSTGSDEGNSGNYLVTFFPASTRNEFHVGGGVMVTIDRYGHDVLSVELTQ